MNSDTSHWLRIIAAVAMLVVSAACSSENIPNAVVTRSNQQPTLAHADESSPHTEAGNAESGAQLFAQGVGGMPSCSTCHALDDSRILGPGMAGIAARAGSRVNGMSAEEYLYTSIIEPGAYVVEGFQNVMPDVFEQSLSEAQIRDLVAYMLTL